MSPQERQLDVGCQLEWSEEGVLAWDQSNVGHQSEQHEGGIHKGGGDLAWVFRACVCVSHKEKQPKQNEEGTCMCEPPTWAVRVLSTVRRAPTMPGLQTSVGGRSVVRWETK